MAMTTAIDLSSSLFVRWPPYSLPTLSEDAAQLVHKQAALSTENGSE
jgi:hypothetical protein